MDDAQYIFLTDSADKKRTARSAKNKVRHTGCHLPSDFMTKQQIRQLNGEVKTMNIRKPMTYRAFKTLPIDIAAEYIHWMCDTFNVRTENIAKMLGTTKSALAQYLCKRKVPVHINDHMNCKKPVDIQSWEHWLSGEPLDEPEPASQNAPESDEKARSETNEVSEGTDTVSQNAPESDENARSETNEETLAYALLIKAAYEENEKLKKQLEKFKGNQINFEMGRYHAHDSYPCDMPTIDEVVTESPVSVATFDVGLVDVRDWDTVMNILKSVPMPIHNRVRIVVESDD